MPKDILSEYGKDISTPQAPRATNGGKMEVTPCDYSPPKGPSNINDPQTPGLHGKNYGNAVKQGKH